MGVAALRKARNYAPQLHLDWDGEGIIVAGSVREIDGDIPADRTSGGDAMATDYLCEWSCFKDLAKMAQRLIRRFGLQAEIGAEHAANSALYCVCRAVAAGKAPRFEPGGEFGKFARVLLVRVVLHARSRARSIRRGGSARDKVPAGGDRGPESGPSLHRVRVDLDGIQAGGPAVEEVVDAAIEVEDLTKRLVDLGLKQIAMMRLQGYTVPEIARETKQSRATVSRKLLQVRTIWRRCVLEG